MKPSEISSFLEKYAAGINTSAEHQDFLNWLKKAPIEEVSHYTEEYHSITERLHKIENQVDSTLVMQIERALDQFELGRVMPLKTPGRVFSWRTMYRSAAAILILFLSAYFIYTILPQNRKNQDQTTPAQPLAQGILPGGNKAVLTLSNGEKLVLDDAKTGELARQGDAQVYKTASGEVVYKTAGDKSAELVFNTLSTPRGGQYKLTLPDGSNVWLNSASSIRYSTVFAGVERKVEVTGEAYFEIARDAAKPFVVNVNEMNIKVLGTHFNVNAYTDEQTVNTTLLEGSVSLSNHGHTAMLKPGQQARLAGDADFKLVNDVDLDEVVAWKNGYFSFNKADLQTVMRQIARWYDVTISYEGKIPQREFVGKIKRNNNVSEVLKILQESKVNFTIEGKKIAVTP